MCSGSKNKLWPFDMEDKSCSKLLELAATDDLSGFIHQVEERRCDINEASYWYARSFGSKKMGFEERTPVMIASLYGSTEVLKYILGTGRVDVNRACGSDGATALHCAAAGGSWSSVEIIKLLIDASGDINAVDASGKKPGDLIAPCVKTKRKTLELLLNGIIMEEGDHDEGNKKKEYPLDVSMPDINDGIYGSDEFRMYNFKVKPCSRAYTHDWTECPFVHPGENARRRDLRKYTYTCVPCPEFKKGSCAKGDACEYAHGVFESWLHPAQYRTRLCKDETSCARKVCFFAHKPEELRPLHASTGSAMLSPPMSGSISSLDSTMLSPLYLGSSSPISASTGCSSPVWQNKTPPALQLPGSRLKISLNARDVEQLVEEMASLSSPHSGIGDLKPTSLDNVFGSLDQSLLPHLQGISPNTASSHSQPPTGLQMKQLRASYPSNISSSTARKPPSHGFMNSRSTAFAKRSQSFIDRRGVSSYSGQAGPMLPSKLSEWSSPDGKLDWAFNGGEANKLNKSTSFSIRSGNALDEPDVSWVESLVRDVPHRRAGLGYTGPSRAVEAFMV